MRGIQRHAGSCQKNFHRKGRKVRKGKCREKQDQCEPAGFEDSTVILFYDFLRVLCALCGERVLAATAPMFYS